MSSVSRPSWNTVEEFLNYLQNHYTKEVILQSFAVTTHHYLYKAKIKNLKLAIISDCLDMEMKEIQRILTKRDRHSAWCDDLERRLTTADWNILAMFCELVENLAVQEAGSNASIFYRSCCYPQPESTVENNSIASNTSME
jgi:hypothetical protein